MRVKAGSSFHLFWATVAVLSCVNAPKSKAPASADTLVLFVTSRLEGQLEPCGCSENMRGGMAKIAGIIENARSEGLDVVYIDAGHALFSSTDSSSRVLKQQEKKARTMANILSNMGAESVTPPSERRNASLNWLEWQGRRLALISANQPAELPALAQTARKQGALWVLGLVEEPFEALEQQLSELKDIDVLVATKGTGDLPFEDNRFRPGTPALVQIQSRGRSLLRVSLHFQGRVTQRFSLQKSAQETQRMIQALDERMALLATEIDAPSLSKEAKALRQAKLIELQQRSADLAQQSLHQPGAGQFMSVDLLPVESTLPSSQSVSALIAAYQNEVALENLAQAVDECVSDEGSISFVGNEPCRACHGPAYDVWKKTKHAFAYQTLQVIQRQYDHDCVGCHVTGHRQLGGVCRIDRVSERDFVGCESCHGPGSLHLKSPSKTTMQVSSWPSVCQTCHNKENSPHFDFNLYLPEILGPGHGQATPLAPP